MLPSGLNARLEIALAPVGALNCCHSVTPSRALNSLTKPVAPPTARVLLSGLKTMLEIEAPGEFTDQISWPVAALKAQMNEVERSLPLTPRVLPSGLNARRVTVPVGAMTVVVESVVRFDSRINPPGATVARKPTSELSTA
jgi:hypothetical protein